MDSLQTDFLTSTPSFVTGMASAVNLAGNFYRFNESATAQEADQKAISADWRIAAADVKKAFEELASKQAVP